MILGDDGTLYGTTSEGGSAGLGTVFSLTPPATPGDSWTEDVLYSFQGGSDGGSPEYTLALYAGTLYGVTTEGGPSSTGTVFSLAPPTTLGGAWTETVIYSFPSFSDGVYPAAGLAVGPGGVLYGTASEGGTMRCNGSGCGTLFALSPPTGPGGPWTFNLLHKFAGNSKGAGSPNPDGAGPTGTLAIGGGGALYGVTNSGGIEFQGVVFELAPPASPGAPWTESILHTFSGNDGRGPDGGLGGDGSLYGTTYEGGPYADGVVFVLRPPKTPGAWLEIPLHEFSGPDGAQPGASLALGGGGTLYGSTASGGPINSGTVFQSIP